MEAKSDAAQQHWQDQVAGPNWPRGPLGARPNRRSCRTGPRSGRAAST